MVQIRVSPETFFTVHSYLLNNLNIRHIHPLNVKNFGMTPPERIIFSIK